METKRSDCSFKQIKEDLKIMELKHDDYQDKVNFRNNIYTIKTIQNKNKNKDPKMKVKWDEKEDKNKEKEYWANRKNKRSKDV